MSAIFALGAFLAAWWPVSLALLGVAICGLLCCREPVSRFPAGEQPAPQEEDLRCQALRDAEEVAALAWEQWPVSLPPDEEGERDE